jgi:hypothetical protein
MGEATHRDIRTTSRPPITTFVQYLYVGQTVFCNTNIFVRSSIQESSQHTQALDGIVITSILASPLYRSPVCGANLLADACEPRVSPCKLTTQIARGGPIREILCKPVVPSPDIHNIILFHPTFIQSVLSDAEG